MHRVISFVLLTSLPVLVMGGPFVHVGRSLLCAATWRSHVARLGRRRWTDQATVAAVIHISGSLYLSILSLCCFFSISYAATALPPRTWGHTAHTREPLDQAFFVLFFLLHRIHIPV
jgi:hypothetical protein